MRKTYAVLLLGLSVGVLAAPAGEKGKPLVQSNDEAKVFQLTNQERAQEKVGPLKLSALLCKIARAHSQNMARQEKMEHKLDDKTPSDRVREGGYRYQAVGENLASGSKGASLENIMKAWMASKGHRANILEDDYTETGVGIAHDEKGRMYITQVFARPQP